jgi:hypothetical protein
LALSADEFGNPQAQGIYDRSDDHPLGGGRNVTVIHAPKERVVLVDESASQKGFAPGRVYRDSKGNRAIYRADGTWQELD